MPKRPTRAELSNAVLELYNELTTIKSNLSALITDESIERMRREFKRQKKNSRQSD